MDISTISTALGSLKTATDIAKFIFDSGISLEKAESKLKFAELISALADAKIQISDIQLAMLEKDNEIRSLKAQQELQTSLRWEDPYYWRMNGDLKDGPFCQPCFDKDKILSRLQAQSTGHWGCRVCRQGFTESGARKMGLRKAATDYDVFGES